MGTQALTPDVSGLSQPGAQAPAGTSAPTPTQAAGGMVSPASPHGRLLQMVQSLAVGVDSFARAAATHGREGGVGEVQDYFAKQQAEKLQQEQATTQQAKAKQESEETDLRMSTMRAHMAMENFSFEQARLRAPAELQKQYNEVAQQQMSFMEELSKASGLPLMVVNSMVGDGTGKTIGAVADVAKQNNTTIHDAAWAHVQNNGAPGNGSQIKGLDLKNFGNTIIPSESSAAATLPVKTQLAMGEKILGADDPTVKGGKQAFDLLQQGLSSGQMTANQYFALASRISAPIVSALQVKEATTKAQEQQADLLKKQQETTPEFQVSQAARKAAAEAQARQPYEVALKNMEVPIAAGVANNKDARDKVSTNYLKPFADKMQNVDELKASVAGAEAGNVAASRAVILKLLGVSTPGGGNKKISPEALRDMGAMGSVPQKFIGSIKEALTGDKWTKEMSEDILAFANDQAKTAQTALRSGIQQTNVLYKTKIDAEAVLAAAGVKTSDSLPQGGGKAAKWGIHVPSVESLKP